MQSQERFDRENAQSVLIAKMLREPTAGSGKPRHGHEKHCPAARIEATKKNKRAREEPSRPPARTVLQGSLHGYSAVVLEGHERARQSELGFEQQNRFRNLREIQRIEKKAFRARADAAQSTRQGGTEPGTTRFRDGRRTTGPPAPRRGPGAPTAQPRPRGPNLESAQI